MMKKRYIIVLLFTVSLVFFSSKLFSQIDTTKTLSFSDQNVGTIDNYSLGNMINIEKDRKKIKDKVLIYHNNKFYQFDNYIDSLKLKENIKFRVLRDEELKEFLSKNINTVILTESDYISSK